MPTTFTFPLPPAEARALPLYPGRALHALFYQWLAIGDYSLSTRVHNDDGPRPFTVAPLRHVNGQPILRFTLLDDTLWPALEKGIAKTPTVEVMRRPLTLSSGGLQVEQRSYANLAARVHADTRIGVHFLSPATFHVSFRIDSQSHGMYYPLPDPRKVFQSWLNRWNEFAPKEHRINVALLDIVEVHVAVGRYDTRTERVDLGEGRKEVGFVGSVQYNVIRAGMIGGEWLRRLNLLADYATYCGTGHKTAQGMGQTVRV